MTSRVKENKKIGIERVQARAR